jgi:hypothetical protein
MSDNTANHMGDISAIQGLPFASTAGPCVMLQDPVAMCAGWMSLRVTGPFLPLGPSHLAPGADFIAFYGPSGSAFINPPERRPPTTETRISLGGPVALLDATAPGWCIHTPCSNHTSHALDILTPPTVTLALITKQALFQCEL